MKTTLQKVAQHSPVVMLVGPRQSGKTTLLKDVFSQHRYINAEALDIRERLIQDPKSLFHSLNDHWIIDEVQHVPDLMSWIQSFVDENPKAGQFILSGSQNLLLMESVSQSLAGRVITLELLPLSYQEYRTHKPAVDVWTYVFHGGYPRPYQEDTDRQMWMQSYIRTYVERDVRSLLNIKNLRQFRVFLTLCAGWHGQLLNMSSIAESVGVSQPTIDQWISLLEATFLVFRLHPYFENYKKRIIKTPKLYFYDSGLVCALLGIESPQHLAQHSHRGALFEGFVFTELIKSYKNKGKTPPLYFWRDHRGLKVDGLMATSPMEIFEIKSSSTFHPSLIVNLQKFQRLAHPEKSYLFYTGEESFPYKNFHVTSWADVHQYFHG